MKSLLFLFGLMFARLCFAQHDPTLVSKQLINTFLQAINIPEYRLVDKPRPLIDKKLLERISAKGRIFDSVDIAFVEQPRHTVKSIIWDTTYVNNVEILIADTVLKAANQKRVLNEDIWTKQSGMKAFYMLSFPLFSKDLNSCIMTVAYHYGALCGHGSINIYQRTDKGWVLKEKWLSGKAEKTNALDVGPDN